MSGCPAFGASGPDGIAQALRVIDCETVEGTAHAFSRLFGTGGALLPALTILLTLYVGWTAVGLLTGRGRIGMSALTPRMLTLGAALTFATSWAAYQSVVWNLLVGAPDQLAGLLLGTHGSATSIFADRLDGLFSAVASAAEAAQKAQGPNAKGWQPADLLWLSAMLLLLGTAGVLITARIALAALLALGPVFMVLALFRGTRGLFEGWLKAAVLLAVVPLFSVLIGGGAIMMLTPVSAALGAEPTMQQAATMFLGAAVYTALMGMVLKVAGQLVAGWRLGGHGEPQAPGRGTAPSAPADASPHPAARMFHPTQRGVPPSGTSDRVRAITAAVTPRPVTAAPAPARSQERTRSLLPPPVFSEAARATASAKDGRTRAAGLGRALTTRSKETHA